MGYRPAVAQDGPAVRVATRGYPVGAEFRIRIAEAAVSVFDIEPEEVVLLFTGRGAIVPTQAHAHRELRSYLPVILGVRREIMEDVRLRIAGLCGRAQRTGYKSTHR